MTPSNQLEAFSRVKSFYLEVALRLKQYLQFENKLLRNCSALCPTKKNNKKLEKKFVFLAESFPSVVPTEELSSLRLEVRVLQSNTSSETPDDKITSYWTKIQNTGKFPVLTKLVRAILVLPHGNADVERVFSNLSDVVQKKRQSLNSETITALVVSRSCLRVKCWTPPTLPMTPQFLELAESAHARAKSKAEERKQDEEKKRRDALEKELMIEIEKDKGKCAALSKLHEEEKCVEKELEMKLQERQRAQNLLAQLTASAAKTDEDVDRLQKQKSSLLKKRSRESDKVVQGVLKRFVVDTLKKH